MGLKVYELTTQGTLLGTDWLVVQRGTDPAKKRSISDILNDGLACNFGALTATSVVSTGRVTANDVRALVVNTVSGERNTAAYIFFEGNGWGYNSADNEIFYNVGGTIPFRSKDGAAVFNGTVTATGFIPFTGCHIAKSNEVLQLGELVQIKSIGWVNPKQPDWIAEYCNGSSKGVYGVVYDIQVVHIMEDTEEKDEEGNIIQIKTGEFTQYLIAAVGDGFIEVDCACEYGDRLIPSETKGLATVYKGTGYPRNFVGIAGEDSEGGKISWVKE